MRMSGIFRATIIGESDNKEKIEVSQKPSKDYVSGKVGVVLDIYSSKNVYGQNESVILDLLNGYAYDENEVKIKLIRHHFDEENPRTEVQVFAVNEALENWWSDIEMMTQHKHKIN